MNKISQARDAFVAAQAAFDTGYEEYKALELDLAIARRLGEGVSEAEANLKAAQNTVFCIGGLYQQRNSAAVALCEALEIAPSVLRQALS